MKVYQSKLTLGSEGKVLIDSTNRKSNSTSKSNKKKNDIENSQPSKSKRKDGIYADPPSETKKQNVADSSTQTESMNHIPKNDTQKVIDMMTSETAPSEYWEQIAEKRRIALNETLEENKLLKDENEYLKGENTILEEMLEEAKQLAALIQSVTGDNEPSEPTETRDTNEADEAKESEEPETESSSNIVSTQEEEKEESFN